jgi:colanic acid/amylovoran biosynthesis glycosyltransferase
MEYNLCIIKPNKNSFSETFIQAHIDKLQGNKKVLYGGTFPIYDHEGKFLIRSPWSMMIYLVKKRIFKQENISELDYALCNYLIKQNINVVLAEYGMVGARVMTACKMANVPLVIHFHGADAHHRPTIEKYKELYKKAFEYTKAIVVVSEDMRKALLDLEAPREKLFLNPYGVDVDEFSPANVIQSERNFLSVGRFVAKKAPLITIAAFKILLETYNDAHLWMVGDGPLLNAAKQKAEELNITENITFTGILSHSQIIELLGKMRCFVQHSVTAADGDMEGTPNTILEASACGVPIVSTCHAGIKEAVIDGVTGLLCNEYDTAGMANNMITVAESAVFAEKLGNAGRNHILMNYKIKDRIHALDIIIQHSINK